VLVVLDGPGLRSHPPLTSVVTSLTIVLQGLVLIAILMLCMLGALSPPTLVFARTTPAEIAILLAWIAGLFIVAHSEDRKTWRTAREEVAYASPIVAPKHQPRPIGHVAALFAFAAVTTLVCGVVLALTSEVAATRFHVTGVLFGATVLAAVTALPEVTTGLYAVRAGRYELAMSDVIGGNAFLPVLFLLGTLLTGKALLPDAQGPDLYLTALGALLTAVYCIGIVLRSNRLLLGAGIDSIVVLAIYAVGIAGLFFVAK
jgi:cation:H+ antiporter